MNIGRPISGAFYLIVILVLAVLCVASLMTMHLIQTTISLCALGAWVVAWNATKILWEIKDIREDINDNNDDLVEAIQSIKALVEQQVAPQPERTDKE